MSDIDGFSRLETKLDTLIRLIALDVTGELKSVKERAILLNKAGLAPREIAILCDTTPNTVSVALSTAKKDAKPKNATKRESTNVD